MKRQRDSQDSLFKKLSKRASFGSPGHIFERQAPEAKFVEYSHKGEFDLFDPEATKGFTVSFLRKRTRIAEIISVKNLAFCLNQSGVCTVLNSEKKTSLGMLNIASDEVIRSVFYNRLNDSIVTVSVYRRDKFTTLRCRSTPVRYIVLGKMNAGTTLFPSENLVFPGFIEFDELNGTALSFEHQEGVYKVWSLQDYSHMYSIPGTDVLEVKISHGTILVVYKRQAGHIPFKILNIVDGAVLLHWRQIINRSKRIELVELCAEKLLLKQEGENLHIIDVWSRQSIEVAQSESMAPHAFIYLHQQRRFLTLANTDVTMWDLNGVCLNRFSDVSLWFADAMEATANVCVTRMQEMLISLCKHSRTGRPCVKVSTTNAGRCVATIVAENSELNDTTALCYNEESNQIFSGTRDSLLHIWSN